MLNKKQRNRAISAVLTAAILLLALAPVITAFADNGTISIGSEEDFIKFAASCKRDTWSQGKTVYLNSDLDFSDKEFKPIPTFGGVFRGNGHIISGVNISSKGSALGVFRYIQKGGTVENIIVKGQIKPDGTKSKVGGIVGENSGVVKNCSFNGSVAGETDIGGICGYLTESGVLSGCSAEGDVTGISYTGGICGENFGLIENCDNRCGVNTTDNEPSKSIQDLDIDIEDLRTTENIDVGTDTGGVCGFSKGRIIKCINYGSVGYMSVGYNTGGICGRQSGFIQGCENYGTINGRKDIGGIVGQAEPYILLEYTEDVLHKLDGVLSDIQDIVDESDLLSGDSVEKSLNSIDDNMTLVNTSAENLAKDAEKYADDIAGEANRLSDELSTALKNSSDALDSVAAGTDKIADSCQSFTEAGEQLKLVADMLKAAADAADGTGSSLSDAATYLERASKRISDSLAYMEECISGIREGSNKLKTALDALKKALEDKKNREEEAKNTADAAAELQNSMAGIGDAINQISVALEEISKGGLTDTALKSKIDEIAARLKNLSETFTAVSSALRDVTDAFLLMAEGFDIQSAENALRNLSKGFDFMGKAFSAMRSAVRELNKAADELDGISDTAKNAIDALNKGISTMEEGIDFLTDGVEKLSKEVKRLADEEAFKLPSAEEALDKNIDDLSGNINGLKDEFSKLRDVLRNKKNDTSDRIDKLSDRLKELSDILSDSYNKRVDADEDGFVEDISDKDTAGDTRGKIESSYNSGSVFGDVCAGGIVGAMAIEYDFDPEDDVKNEGGKTLEFTYKTKCVIRRCANRGAVTSKKNHSGGVAGRMDIGSVISCENYGPVSSDDGDCVGGIAGESKTVIRNSAVKCSLEGNNYIGGTAGKAEEVSGCYTLVSVPRFEEAAGTIAGSADRTKIKNNFFVSEVLGGIDDISYTASAEETDIDNFVRYVKRGFGTDVEFALTFVADDNVIATVPFKYKDSISPEAIPKVPEKDGYYGRWSYYDYSMALFDATINAEYYRDLDLITSGLKREDGKSVILICGAFDDNSKVEAVKYDAVPDKLKNKRITDSYSVKIDGSYTEKYKVRYLPLGKSQDIYVEYPDHIEKVKTSKFGSYLELETTDSSFNIFEVKKSYAGCIAVGIIAAVLIALAVFFLLRRRKRK